MDSGTLGASLLPWVKSFDEIGPATTESWGDLSDGHKLWAISQDVDAEYFNGSLPEPDVGKDGDWTRKWQNLKQVERQVSTYYRDVCNGHDGVSTAYAPDLKAIAATSSQRELEKLIMMIIRAAMASPDSNQSMAQRLMSLGRENAMVIATELRNMEEADYDEMGPPSRDESAYSEQDLAEATKPNGQPESRDGYGDPLLEREEELLQAQATIDKLQASQVAAQGQIQELRQEKDKLQEAFDAYHSEVSEKGLKPGAAGDDFKKLQRQADNDRAYIDDLEIQMQNSRDTIETYERQLERHRAENDSGQKLRDDLQVLRAENEDLNQKIKMNENLKKKILTLQESDKANASLRDELKAANDKLEELDRIKSFQSSLEKEIIEKKGLIRNQEYQINELATMRKHAEYEARVLAQKLEAAKDRHDQDHEAMQEMRLKMQDASLDDTDIDDSQIGDTEEKDNESEQKSLPPKNDENKHLHDKLALLEQQLEASDARLKQAAERHAALEDEGRTREADTAAQEAADKQAAEHEATIQNLQKQLEIAEAKQKELPPPPTSEGPDLASLERENRLMATAWYDLSSRLQNHGVSLARRKQDPKSWIGKQRNLVGPGSSMVGRT